MDEFAIGDRVICVPVKMKPAQPSWRALGFSFPKPMYVYTVREVVADYNFAGGRSPAIRLTEVVNPVVQWTDGTTHEVAWGTVNFRLLRDEAIHVFREIVAAVENNKVYSA